MDDAIIATANNPKEHRKKVHQFLDKLAWHDLFLKPEKCHFHKEEVEYLGVIIRQGKVQMDLTKVQGITDWPTPLTVNDVWSFLGFCNFYRAFIPKFSHITCPLNNLTKKACQWLWGVDEEASFNNLKRICASYPVLQTPNWTKQFILETDTSKFALGAVIM